MKIPARRFTRALGLCTVMSYTAVVMVTWISANLHGYLYFSAGEPVLLIKYAEWGLGFLGIFACVDMLRAEVDNKAAEKET